MRKYYLRAFTFVVMVMAGMTQQMFAEDDLQEYLNSLSAVQTRSGSEQMVIDLSQFSATVRENTLAVNGRNVKFINGTLSRTESLEGPILQIYGGSEVELGENAIISGAGLYLKNELVRVEDASFTVSGGTIKGLGTLGLVPVVQRVIMQFSYDDAVRLTHSESVFRITGGNIAGTVLCKTGTHFCCSFDGGEVKDVETNTSIFIRGDAKISSITTSADVHYYSADATVGTINLARNDSRLYLWQHLTKNIIVKKGNRSDTVYDPSTGLSEIVTAGGFWCVTDGAVVASATEYIYEEGLTAEDVSHIKEPYGRGYINGQCPEREYEYVVENEGRDLVIRPKSTDISTADDLQAKLDEIAAEGTYTWLNPDTIRIPESGIVIDKQIYLKENCHAVLTGGNISFAGQYISAFSTDVESSLTFKDITIDFAFWPGMSYFVEFYSGRITFDENVEFINIPAEYQTALCYLGEDGIMTYKSGNFFSNRTAIKGNGRVDIYGGRIESAATAIEANSVWLMYVETGMGGTIIGGDVVIDCNHFGINKGATIKSSKDNAYLVKLNASDAIGGGAFVGNGARMYIKAGLGISIGVQVPILELSSTAQVFCLEYDGTDVENSILSSIETLNNPSSTEDQRIKAQIYLLNHKKTIISNWADRELNKDIVTGITEDMFKYLFEFVGVPENLEVYYNAERQSAQLREKKTNNNNDDLQDFLDGLGDNKGTEEDPVEIPIADEVDLGGDVNLGGEGDDLQAFLDGLKGDGSNKSITFNGGNLNIAKGSTLTIRNVDFVATGKGGYINVSGTLIIDININIVNIIRFINVLPGGRVIWRDGSGSGNCGETVIYINLGGHVEYAGGDYSGGNYGFYNYGGTIYVSGGTIHGGWSGGYTYSGGTTYISGGTVSGGYINWGQTTITGGTIIGTVSTGDGSGIWHVENGVGGTIIISGGNIGGNGGTGGIIGNGGNIYLDGGTHGITDIYVIRGGKIYINFDLTVLLRIHINIEDIVLNTPIILGYDGYRLTEDSLKNIEIILPEGYTWEFDSEAGAIVIVALTGINDVMTNKNEIEAVYSISGQKLDNLQKGLNIIRRKDGTMEKIMVK